jgi:hypothetical protein
MTMFAEPSNDPTKKCVTMTKRGFVAEKCTDELEHFVCLGKGNFAYFNKILYFARYRPKVAIFHREKH